MLGNPGGPFVAPFSELSITQVVALLLVSANACGFCVNCGCEPWQARPLTYRNLPACWDHHGKVGAKSFLDFASLRFMALVDMPAPGPCHGLLFPASQHLLAEVADPSWKFYMASG